MKVSPALRTAVRGFENSPFVSSARHIIPYLDKSLTNISTGVYLDGAEISPDEAALLRIICAQALTGKGGTDMAPCTVVGAIFYRKTGEGGPMNFDQVRAFAHESLRRKGEQGLVVANDFIFGWIGDHFISLDELIEMDDNWGL